MRQTKIKIYAYALAATAVLAAAAILYNGFARSRIEPPQLTPSERSELWLAYEQLGWNPESSYTLPANIPPPDPPRLIPHLESTMETSNNFAFKVLQQNLTTTTRESIAVSPVSLAQAFYLAGNGASGETEIAIRQLLGTDTAWNLINQANQMWLEDLSLLRGIELEIASSVWTTSGIVVNPAFIETARSYESEMRTLPPDPRQAVVEINDWVSSNTRGLIKEIVKRLDENTNLFIANAVYFFGKWSNPFDQANTKLADFHLPDGTVAKCNLMWQKDEFLYAETEQAQLIRLPYGPWHKCGMVVVLPRRDLSANAMALQLSSETYRKMRNALNAIHLPPEGVVEIPRFELDSQPELSGVYPQLGIDPAHLADFSGISPDLSNNRILDVVHRVVVKVDESGTEAAASTGLSAGYMAEPEQRPPFHFRADRPFLFFIEDSRGVVLFAGVVNNVTATEPGLTSERE